jgi:ferrous iron transport protein A
MTTLSEMPIGTSADLIHVGGQRAFRRRLMEMGLLPGTSVRLVRRGRTSGLLEVEVRGCYLSLRKSEADELLLQDP